MKDPSNRTDVLFALIREYVEDGMSFLDLGCGYCGFPEFQGTSLVESIKQSFRDIEYCGIDRREDVIEKCRESYPECEWLCAEASDFESEKRYDFVIHTGFDKWWSDLWRVHLKLFEKNLGPSFVLLEAGSPIGKHSEHLRVFNRVKSIYRGKKYLNPQTGSYVWTLPVSQPQRCFSVFKRKS